MALSAGTVTIDDAGEASGSGMARALYDSRIAAPLTVAFLAEVPAERQAAFKTGLAEDCNAIATGIVGYLTANAEVEVTIGTGDSGLQRMSNPVVADADTQGPSVAKTLAGTIS